MFPGAKSLRISANGTVVWDANWITKVLPYWLVLIEPNGLLPYYKRGTVPSILL